jgi:putative flippase GtrA
VPVCREEGVAHLRRTGIPVSRIGRVNRLGVPQLLTPRQLKFLAAGVLTVVTDYGTFFVAYGILHLSLSVATVASFMAGLAVSFGLNKLWVFESRGDSIARSVRQLLLYGLLLTFNIAFTYYFIAALQHHSNIDPRVSKLASIGIITAWNYVLYSRVIFLKGQRSAALR